MANTPALATQHVCLFVLWLDSLLNKYSSYTYLTFLTSFFIYYLPVENESRSNAPVSDLNDIINDPMQALTKGWSLLSVGMEVLGTAAVEGARIAAHGAQEVAHIANERVVKPAQEQLNDPNLRANVAGYVSQLGKTVGILINM